MTWLLKEFNLKPQGLNLLIYNLYVYTTAIKLKFSPVCQATNKNKFGSSQLAANLNLKMIKNPLQISLLE